MFEIGDKVVCVETLGHHSLTVGKVYTVDSLWNPGIWVVDDKGDLVGMSSEHFKPYTETEAEKRGAKFGVIGVNKVSGHKITFITDDDKKNTFGQILWSCLDDVSNSIVAIHPSNIRLDHEPEFVAWADAPEHLKYDASRVYYGGKPVKWIAKPDGASLADVVYTTQGGIIRTLSDYLTVKL